MGDFVSPAALSVTIELGDTDAASLTLPVVR
jgi:hypothetical protein